MLDLLGQLTAPFALFFSNTDRIYWLYLLSAFEIAYILFLLHKQDYAKSGGGVIAYVFPKDIILHRSSVNDYLFFYTSLLFQGAFVGVLFSSLSFVVTYFTETSLNDWLPLLEGRLQGFYGMGLLSTVFLLAAADFALFFSHFLQHRIPWLW